MSSTTGGTITTTTSASPTTTGTGSSTASFTPNTSTGSFTPPPPVETSQSSDPGNSGSVVTTNGTLYLYTFLATLVLLLAVSCAIVIRSLVIRRRHARMMEEAIANGTWVPPAAGVGTHNRRKRDFGKKPELYEAYVSGDAVEKFANYEKNSMGQAGTEGWEKPLTAAWVRPPMDPTSSQGVQGDGVPTRRSLAERLFFRRPARRPPPAPPPPSSTPAAPPVFAPSDNTDSTPAEPPSSMPVQIAVLIAMPSQGGIAPPPGSTPPLGEGEGDTTLVAAEDEEREAPLVEIGVWRGEMGSS